MQTLILLLALTPTAPLGQAGWAIEEADRERRAVDRQNEPVHRPAAPAAHSKETVKARADRKLYTKQIRAQRAADHRGRLRAGIQQYTSDAYLNAAVSAVRRV